MLDLNELEQLVVFARLGTLSMAAQELHISQPTITRTMQHLEETFGVPLFIRGKNRIALNDTGRKAAAQAEQLLETADNILRTVREYDQSRRTISVTSCAPAPLWYVLPALSAAYPQMTIASSLKGIPSIIEDLNAGRCQLAILPDGVQANRFRSAPLLEEHLYVCVPASHALAQHSSLTFSDINGFNFLLRSEIGFWDDMCRVQMPASRFFVQTDEYEFWELAKASSLPYFTTDLADRYLVSLSSRIKIPVTNPEANVTYYIAYRPEHQAYADSIQQISQRDFSL